MHLGSASKFHVLSNLRVNVRCGVLTELSAELAEVVVGVQPAPAHPFPLGQLAEEGVTDSGDIGKVEACELVDRICLEGREIFVRDALPALIEFRPSGDVFRPGSGRPEGSPFHDGAPVQAGVLTDLNFAERDADGVGEMAHHLSGVHTPPLALIVD
jgi:hypothetical protein